MANEARMGFRIDLEIPTLQSRRWSSSAATNREAQPGFPRPSRPAQPALGPVSRRGRLCDLSSRCARCTKDLDIWVERSSENAQALLAALQAFGFGSLGLTPDDFQADDTIVQLGYEPNRVDLLTSLKGVEFGPCYKRRLEAEVSGVQIPFIASADLILNKTAVGRLQDFADIEQIKRHLGL